MLNSSLSEYWAPQEGAWWACNTGITPCISVSVFNQGKNYCIMAHLLPRILYHEANSFEDAIENKQLRVKREPLSVSLAVLLGVATAAGIGTGTAALVTGEQHLSQLRAAITRDIKDLENSISALEQSLTSLSEVVLQNRRGLDLIFMKEGGLCVALKEECCFYADKTGVVRDSMAKLRKRLEKRQWEKTQQQGWFESWFTKSPWLTTLLSSLAGPLIILLLIVTIGPCILNRLVTFFREQIGNVKLMVIRQQYATLQNYKTDNL